MGVPQDKSFSFCGLNSTLTEDDINGNFLLGANESISEFYANTRIFITGATGFVGKTLVEKLLRSCDKLDSIFLLIRPKKGVSVEQRTRELFKNPLFDIIKEKNPEAFKKVRSIPGDVSQPNLGLSEQDREFLIDNIDIVFHSAATIKFNESLKRAVILNTLGTRRLLDLCTKMKKLKSFVHISTAFSNADKNVVEEIVYKPSCDVSVILNLIELLPDDVTEEISNKILGKHPNTYTFTKALAEQIVSDHSTKFPVAIVRPSIITGAWKEPYPGWVDNLTGITGIIMECARGTIKTIICDEKLRIEIVPVDIVVNTLITTAWHTAVCRSKSTRVYNCTSGQLNPLTWKYLKELTLKYSVVWPSKYVTWYPGFTYRTNKTMHNIIVMLYHYLPSAVLDLYLCSIGEKPMMLKTSKKFYKALEEGKFFSTHEWDFKQSTMKGLLGAMKFSKDSEQFHIDFSPENGFSWDSYLNNLVKGIRQFVLKDDMSSLQQAKVKLNRLFWFKRIFQVASFYLMFRLIVSYSKNKTSFVTIFK